MCATVMASLVALRNLANVCSAATTSSYATFDFNKLKMFLFSLLASLLKKKREREREKKKKKKEKRRKKKRNEGRKDEVIGHTCFLAARRLVKFILCLS